MRPDLALLRPVRKALALTGVAALLLGCAAPGAEVSKARPTAAFASAEGATAPALVPSAIGNGVSRTNLSVATDFLDLTFALESGRPITRMSRFEGPVSIGMTGPAPRSAGTDLDRLVDRIRREAGIDLRLEPQGRTGAITIAFIPKATLRRLAPTAACFVVPGVSSLAEYRRLRGTAALDWTRVAVREKAAIFIPTETSPQEIRDCLHEEVAQALGPLNDLYRLSDSVFNDDNFHTVLTPFDMLILRAYNAPELGSGLTRDEVAARLPALLQRINPSGGATSSARGGDADAPRAWAQAIEAALGGKADLLTRRRAAARALDIAQTSGWQDTRAAFSHFAVARLSASNDPRLAARHFAAAAALWQRNPGTGIQLAHVELQLAAMALAGNRPDEALARVEGALPTIVQAENAALRAMALLIQAEAMAALGRPDEAERLRLDSRRWASYGFGPDADIEARVAEIAARGRQRVRN